METHVKVVGVLYIVLGCLGLVGAAIALVLLAAAGAATLDDTISLIATGIGAVIAFLFSVLSIPCIIGGIGLLKRREWARILVLILSFLNLINFPLGSVIGIYALIVLFNPQTATVFRPLPTSAATEH